MQGFTSIVPKSRKDCGLTYGGAPELLCHRFCMNKVPQFGTPRTNNDNSKKKSERLKKTKSNKSPLKGFTSITPKSRKDCGLTYGGAPEFVMSLILYE